MIYDKNQFVFNIIFLAIIIVLIGCFVFLGVNYYNINEKIQSLNNTIGEVEKNQNYINYIQGAHNDITYLLTPRGFFIEGANDFGTLNGPSMQPTIFDSYTLILLNYNENMSLKVGQIIRFLDDNNVPVIHRVRAIYNDTDSVFVQGDNLPEGEIIYKKKITHIVVGVLFT